MQVMRLEQPFLVSPCHASTLAQHCLPALLARLGHIPSASLVRHFVVLLIFRLHSYTPLHLDDEKNTVHSDRMHVYTRVSCVLARFLDPFAVLVIASLPIGLPDSRR